MDALILGGFILVHIVCIVVEGKAGGRAGKWIEKKHYLVWVFHPSVTHGAKDFMIYVIAELPKHLAL